MRVDGGERGGGEVSDRMEGKGKGKSRGGVA